MDPMADARALVAERFPGALAAFLGGGVLSARRTATSDLDIVVVIAGPPAPFRESLRWRGWPVELFVHDQASIEQLLRPRCRAAQADPRPDGRRRRTAGRPRDMSAGITGTGALRPRGRAAGADRRRTRAGADTASPICWTIWPAAPIPARPRSSAGRSGGRPPSWRCCWPGSWLGGGKWLLRELRAADPALAAELVAASGDPARLTAVADQVLGRAGGRLWAGYRAEGQRD